MSHEKVFVVGGDMVTAYGRGVEACWQGLLSKKTAIRHFDRFDTQHFQSQKAGFIAELDTESETSLVLQMLEPLFENLKGTLAQDTVIFLATTLGEIDYLEKAVMAGSENIDAEQSCPRFLLEKIQSTLGVTTQGMVVSSACASSNTALAQASMMIKAGEIENALVIACDSLSEFVFSGFSSLFALSPEEASPFDQHRKGLNLGEAAGYVLLMSESRAHKDKFQAVAEILSSAINNDANHMTGPSREALGLAKAIEDSLKSAGLTPNEISAISAHGTGTLYNDEMEIKAFDRIFCHKKIPVFSVKGGIGHTLGAAGVIEFLITVKSLKEGKVPGTVGVKEISENAMGWIDKNSAVLEGDIVISTSSGFGGVNAVVIIKKRSEL